MTDYELINMFVEHMTLLQTILMNYVAVLFAFLIAAYLIAAKLESGMVFIIVGLFTLVALPQAINVIGIGYDTAAIAGQIASRAMQDSSGVGWHGTTTWLGTIGITILRASVLLVLVLSYLGGLIFFFHQRHVGRAQLPETTS